jgi:hypothetical protein
MKVIHASVTEVLYRAVFKVKVTDWKTWRQSVCLKSEWWILKLASVLTCYLLVLILVNTIVASSKQYENYSFFRFLSKFIGRMVCFIIPIDLYKKNECISSSLHLQIYYIKYTENI